jgi:signal transduction histidine kinase
MGKTTLPTVVNKTRASAKRSALITKMLLRCLHFAGARRRRLEALVAARTQTLKETNLQLQREIIERQNAQVAAQRYAQTLTNLHQIVRQLTSTRELSQIAAQLAQNGLEVLETECLSVWLREERDSVEYLKCWAAAMPNCQPMHTPFHASLPDTACNILWDVVRKGQSIVINDVPDDPHYHINSAAQETAPLHSLLIVPLSVREITLGALWMANKHNGAFNANDVTLAETLAAAAASAVDNTRLILELRDHAADLERHVAELDAFALSVAHDLKNPLTILVGFSTVLEEEWRDMTKHEIDSSLHSITRTGRKMSDIIEALLLLARLRRSDQIDTRMLDMHTVVDGAQERLRKEIDNANVEIQQPAEWPRVWGHPILVENIWFNYLSNALKYGAQAESTRVLTIEIGFDPPAEYETFVRFWVRDQGVGLTPQAQAQLFTEFTRLEPTRSHGHGLGLSIVRRIAEKLGGDVGVESNPGAGSTFWFTLPRHAGTEGATLTSPVLTPLARG